MPANVLEKARAAVTAGLANDVEAYLARSTLVFALSLQGLDGNIAPFLAATADLWWKNAIIYCLDVGTYMDGNGDGVWDFVGLTDKLDYLAGLGVTCVWLQPFYPSPNCDNGYDVSDYYGVHPKHGTPGEVVEFMNHA